MCVVGGHTTSCRVIGSSITSHICATFIFPSHQLHMSKHSSDQANPKHSSVQKTKGEYQSLLQRYQECVELLVLGVHVQSQT